MKEQLEQLLSQAKETITAYGSKATAANKAMLQDAIAQAEAVLRRGEALIMASDGVDGEGIGTCKLPSGANAGEMAARILEAGGLDAADDATVAVLRLHPLNLST